MAVLSRRLSYLFIMAPRTGCTAVGDILCKEREGWWFPEEDVVHEDGEIVTPRKHTTVAQLIESGLLEREELESLFVFSSVRNPFDSLVSLWVKKRTSYQPLLDDPDSFVHQTPGFAEDMEFVLDHTFSEWIERQYADLVGDGRQRHLYGPYLRDVDHVMHFESLQDDLDDVMQHLGAAPIEIPLLNPTEGRREDYRSYYTGRARAIIESVFAADLERFGYRFDDPDLADDSRHPTEHQAFGPSVARQSPDELPQPTRADASDAPSLTVETLEDMVLICPACGNETDAWAPGPGNRPNARCPHCQALERHRFLAYLLDRFAPLLSSARNVVDVAPQRQIRRLLSQGLRASYIGIDLANRDDLDIRGDVTRLPFQDGTVDVMICYHVLEHVPDDRSAMEEISRILAPGGFALVQTPRRRGTTTDEDPTAGPEERIQRFGQADHVRYYGDDLEERLIAHGLRPTSLRTQELVDEATISRHGLNPSEELWLCRSTRASSRTEPRPNVMHELATERRRRIRAESRADYWERQYRRIREHPAIRVLAPLRRRVRDVVDNLRNN